VRVFQFCVTSLVIREFTIVQTHPSCVYRRTTGLNGIVTYYFCNFFYTSFIDLLAHSHSERLKNYPDPMLVVNECGADALRMYLINSPVVRAEPLKFSKAGVSDTVRKAILPWFNTASFLEQSIIRLRKDGIEFEASKYDTLKTDNMFDQWIRSSFQSLVKFVRHELGEGYRLYTVIPRLVRFIDQLTNWYVRLSRDRLKGFNCTMEDRLQAIATLYKVRFILFFLSLFFACDDILS